MKSQQPDRIAERKASVERWRQRKVLALDVEELKLYMSPDIENLELPHSRADQKRIAREDAEVAKLRSGDRRLLEKFQGDKAWTRERGLFEKRRESVLALSDEKVRQAIKARKQQREHRAQHGPDLW